MVTQAFWQLGGYSDAEVVARLNELVGATRQLTAELIAHLGDVEERRLHLLAACGSMFQYCTGRLGLSEDEACRRIDVARLARRFPVLFPALARGELSLSVAALLKPCLSEENQVELVQRLSGKSVRQAQEYLAALFPRADVESSVRKLPERAAPRAVPVAGVPSGTVPVSGAAPGVVTGGIELAASAAAVNTHAPWLGNEAKARAAGDLDSTRPVGPTALPRRDPPARIEALSAGRYRVQFTAHLTLKEKLELARDLMRHANPTGDFAPILERALDLLLERLMQRRFGKTRRGAHDVASESSRRMHPDQVAPPTGQRSSAEYKPRAGTPARGETARSSGTDRVTNAARRVVLERDGLECSWVDEHGRRCESRAWLELDHRQPRGRGGSSEAHNLRHFCRAHNGLAAERVYGREHVERAVERARQSRTTRPWSVRDSRQPCWLPRSCSALPPALSRIPLDVAGNDGRRARPRRRCASTRAVLPCVGSSP